MLQFWNDWCLACFKLLDKKGRHLLVEGHLKMKRSLIYLFLLKSKVPLDEEKTTELITKAEEWMKEHKSIDSKEEDGICFDILCDFLFTQLSEINYKNK